MPWKLIQASCTQNSSFQPLAQVQSFSRCSKRLWWSKIKDAVCVLCCVNLPSCSRAARRQHAPARAELNLFSIRGELPHEYSISIRFATGRAATNITSRAKNDNHTTHTSLLFTKLSPLRTYLARTSRAPSRPLQARVLKWKSFKKGDLQKSITNTNKTGDSEKA